MHTPYDRPVIPIAFFLIIGILLGVLLPGYSYTILFFFFVSVICLPVHLKRKQNVFLPPLIAIITAGYLSMVPWMSPENGPDHLVNFLNTGYWRIQGVVKEQPVVLHGRARTIIKVNTLFRDGISQTVRGRIRLTVMGDVELTPGDRLTFSAKLRPFRNFKNPGSFDYRRHMAFKGIHGSAWVRAENLRYGRRSKTSLLTQLTGRAHRKLARLIDGTGTPSRTEERAVLKALVYGDRAGIDDNLRQRFNRAGAGHLLAISGLHVGIVATVAFAFFHRLFSFFPFLLWRGWGRLWTAAASLLPVLAYGILAGMSPSTQRAEIMVGLFLVAIILGRFQDIFNTLALAALVILLLFPPALFTISFQLSFAAVLAIVYGLEKVKSTSENDVSRYRRAFRRIKNFILVSAFAIAGTIPLALFYFNQTSVVGLVANLFLIPLVGFVAVPLGLLSALLSIFFEPAATLGFSMSLNFLHLALAVIDFFAGWTFASIKTVTPSILEIFLYYTLGWALLNLRSRSFASWVLAVTLIVAVGDGLYWSYLRFWHRDLAVTAIDVGQGGSTLLELPGGNVILYDGGGFSDNRFFDMGKQVVAPLLWQKKIATVDILILSHPDADHLNGLIYIAENFGVRELWTNGDINTTKGYKALMAVCKKGKVVVRRIDSGFGQRPMGPVMFTVFNPPEGFFSTSGKIRQEYRNEGSLVIKVALGKTAFLLTGDIEAGAESQLVRESGENLASTVLFAPHHGSKTSNSPAFIKVVDPNIVVISAGDGNRFGFPHAEVVDRYVRAGSRILCTATHGAIVMRSNGDTVYVQLKKRSLN